MRWRMWKAMQLAFDCIGLVLAYPGLRLLDLSDECGRRKMAAKARNVKPRPIPPGFSKARRVE